MKVKMHRIEVADLCQAAGIKNARQLGTAIGMYPEAAYHLWSGNQKMIKLDTINVLTTLLGCQVEDIIRVEEVDEEDLEEEGETGGGK